MAFALGDLGHPIDEPHRRLEVAEREAAIQLVVAELPRGNLAVELRSTRGVELVDAALARHAMPGAQIGVAAHARRRQSAARRQLATACRELRSRASAQKTQAVAVGSTSSRSTGIGSPQSSHVP